MLFSIIEGGDRYLSDVEIESRSQLGGELNDVFLKWTRRVRRACCIVRYRPWGVFPRPPKIPNTISLAPELGEGRAIYAKPTDWEERGDAATLDASNDCGDGVFDLHRP